MDVVFVHIPKTGGMSLRTYLAQNLTSHRAIFDYGSKQRLTDKMLLQKYRDGDEIDLRNLVHPQEKMFVSGHFSARKYADQFSPMSFISVVREPFERIVSLYNHLVGRTGFAEEFPEFIRKEGRINAQHKVLSGIDIKNSGLIFTISYYDEGIQLLKRGLSISAGLPFKRNKGTYTKSLKAELEKYRSEFADLNRLDYELFNEVAAQGAVGRLVKETDTLGPVCGDALLRGDGTIEGWMASECGKAPLFYEVLIDGTKVGEGLADMFRADIRERGITPHGVCGFRVAVPGITLQDLGSKEIVVRETGGSGFQLKVKDAATSDDTHVIATENQSVSLNAEGAARPKSGSQNTQIDPLLLARALWAEMGAKEKGDERGEENGLKPWRTERGKYVQLARRVIARVESSSSETKKTAKSRGVRSKAKLRTGGEPRANRTGKSINGSSAQAPDSPKP